MDLDKKTLRIVYMGTPEFAVEPLKKLVDNDYNVVGVITMPDKPAGRGYKLQESAVKQYAVKEGIEVLQPTNLKDEEFLIQLKMLNADLQIVVAFRMLPEVVWNMPRLGSFNLHASLLPQYRGAAPINWAVINGEKQTGVTTFFLKHEIDTGNILMQEAIDIADDENVGSVHDRLKELGSDLVCKTVDKIIAGEINGEPQNESIELKAAPKIFKTDCLINFNQSAVNVKNHIRGLSPYPAAFTNVKDEKGNVLSLKIFDAEMVNGALSCEAAKFETDNKTYLRFAANDGYIDVKELQLAGKKRMKTADLLRGTNLYNV